MPVCMLSYCFQYKCILCLINNLNCRYIASTSGHYRQIHRIVIRIRWRNEIITACRK